MPRDESEVILDIHSRLSLLIAPTTALSLQTSEPEPGRRSIFGRLPPLVQYVIAIAFISAICFVISATQIAGKKHTPAARAARQARQASAIAPPLPSEASAPLSPPQSSAPDGPTRASAGVKS